MNTVLYFGKIKFNINSEFELNLKENEKKFLKPRFSVEQNVEVHIKQSKDKSQINGKLIWKDKNVQIYEEDNREIRYYYESVHRICYAKSKAEKDRINIYYYIQSNMKDKDIFSIINLMQIEQFLLEKKGILLHCAYIKYKNRAILFSAPSGTGKTTQANLWQKYQECVSVVNGDRALLQKEGNIWYAGGFPIHGTSKECQNEKTKIEVIVIVRQSIKDEIIELSVIEKIKLIFSEITVNIWNPNAVDEVLQLIQDIVSEVKVIQLNCTMKKSAVEVLNQYLYGE